MKPFECPFITVQSMIYALRDKPSIPSESLRGESSGGLQDLIAPTSQ
jgi:hypothetical protein